MNAKASLRDSLQRCVLKRGGSGRKIANRWTEKNAKQFINVSGGMIRAMEALIRRRS